MMLNKIKQIKFLKNKNKDSFKPTTKELRRKFVEKFVSIHRQKILEIGAFDRYPVN